MIIDNFKTYKYNKQHWSGIMSKEQNVINYYVLCNRLKDVVRTG